LIAREAVSGGRVGAVGRAQRDGRDGRQPDDYRYGGSLPVHAKFPECDATILGLTAEVLKAAFQRVGDFATVCSPRRS